MKVFTALITVSFLFGSGAAIACGTHPPAVQSKINAEELAELQKLARAAVHDADEILLGTVTDLTRPTWGSPEFGSVSFNVSETLKGEPSSTRTAQWKDKFIYSCQPSAMFHNVGFRLRGKFIVYIRGGDVVRSAAADHLRSGLLTLEQEQAIAVGGGGS